jgi:hypothetical protein
MLERGFTYYPEPWEDMPDTFETNRPFAEGDRLWLPTLPTTREEVEAEGYGIQAPLEVRMFSEETLTPNESYRDSLSPAAQELYDLALYGPDPYAPVDPNATAGCLELTMGPEQELTITAKTMFWSQYSELVLAMTELAGANIYSDPRIVEINHQWATCMKNKGYDLASGALASPDDIDPWDAWQLARHTLPDGTLGESWYTNPPYQLTPPEERSLSGSPAELAIALDDFDCRTSVDYMSIFYGVQWELEAAFVEEHQDQLTEMMEFAAEHPV